MTIDMRKIGTVLDSRPAGREALLALRPRLKDAADLIIDFAGVNVLTPSFADEFVTPLTEEFTGRIALQHTRENITVEKTLEFLAKGWTGKVAME